MRWKSQTPITLDALALIEAVEPTSWLDIAMIRVMREAFLHGSTVHGITWRQIMPKLDSSGLEMLPAEIPLSRQTIKALMNMRKERRAIQTDYRIDEGALVFPFCRKTVTRHIEKITARAGLSGGYGSDSPALGMQHDLADHFNLPPNFRTSDSLAASLAPHYIAAIAA